MYVIEDFDAIGHMPSYITNYQYIQEMQATLGLTSIHVVRDSERTVQRSVICDRDVTFMLRHYIFSS